MYKDPLMTIENEQFKDWQEIDIIVSRDCLLRCKYCYLHKSKDKTYDLDSIIKNLDNFLYTVDSEGVVFSLYPEPWVNISRTEEIITRILEILPNHPQFMNNFMFMLGTCGVGLDKPIPVLEKILDHVSLSVSIDGTKEHHDLYRVFPNGKGSHDLVVNNIKTYQEKYGIYSTKVTIGPDTIKYIYESTLYLWNEVNITSVYMNVVFEDLWGTQYKKLQYLNEFEQQLQKLTDYIIKEKIWKTKFTSIVSNIYIKDISFPSEKLNRTYCGAAVMRSIDSDGSIYPCFRLSPYSLQEKTFNIKNNEVLRSLKILDNYDAAPKQCWDCDLLNICSMCVGHAYDINKTLFNRTTDHCEFIKLQHKYSTILRDAIKREEKNEI